MQPEEMPTQVWEEVLPLVVLEAMELQREPLVSVVMLALMDLVVVEV